MENKFETIINKIMKITSKFLMEHGGKIDGENTYIEGEIRNVSPGFTSTLVWKTPESDELDEEKIEYEITGLLSELFLIMYGEMIDHIIFEKKQYDWSKYKINVTISYQKEMKFDELED